MDIPAMAGVTVVVTQFMKRLFSRFGIKVEGAGAIVLSVVAGVAVVLYNVVSGDVPFAFSLAPVLIQVVVLANTGYSLLKVAGGK